MKKRSKVQKKQSSAELELETFREEIGIPSGGSVVGYVRGLNRKIAELQSRDKQATAEIMRIRKVLGAVNTESVLEAAKRVTETPRWNLNYQYVLRVLIGARHEETTEEALERVCQHLAVVKTAISANRAANGEEKEKCR